MYSTRQANLVSDYGQFFQQWDWDHYATLTFACKQSPASCIRHWNEFIDYLGHVTRGRVGWIRSDEERWSGCGTPEVPLHFHSLLKYQHVPAPEAVEALWKAKAGDAQVEAYLRDGGGCGGGGGAALYVAKMLPNEDTRYDMGGLKDFPRTGDSPIRGSRN